MAARTRAKQQRSQRVFAAKEQRTARVHITDNTTQDELAKISFGVTKRILEAIRNNPGQPLVFIINDDWTKITMNELFMYSTIVDVLRGSDMQFSTLTITKVARNGKVAGILAIQQKV